jgi:hypothetical protein
MIDGVMRFLHLPWWVPFVVWFSIYTFWASGAIINGYAQEYMGWRHPGRPGKIHKVLLRYHLGLHAHPDRSHGDERRLKRTAGATNRATPEGQMVYWDPHGRPFRVIRNNLVVIVVLSVLAGFVDSPKAIVIVVTLMALFAIPAWAGLKIRKARKRASMRRPVTPPAMSQTAKAKVVFLADPATDGARPRLVEEAKPQLTGVPQYVLANLMAGDLGCSSEEVLSRLKLTPDGGSLALPDTFKALLRQREDIQELVRAHTDGDVRFTWATTITPRTLSWVPIIVPKLPDMVRFRDHLDKIESLDSREFALGARPDLSMYVQSHRGDIPWWCRFMGSGTGKSTGFQVKAAQIAHKDPKAEIYCIDTKQVSFEPLHGIPGIHIFDNPVTEMDKIWEVFYTLNGIMVDRYTAVREKRARLADFHDIWVLVDEGNHLGSKMKSYSANVLDEPGASPRVWGEAIAPLLQQGRQASIFGEWMFQDVTDRAMGNQSLKMAFGAFCAAGFHPGQFTRTIGPPAEECLEGQGRMLICQGNKRTWIQGYYDDPQWLHDYALENRREKAA